MGKLAQKNDEFSVLITDLSLNGLGIGKYEGFTWFIQGAVPGDLVLAHATKVLKHYGYAFTARVLKPSPDRAEPPCEAADRCGGCSLMSMSYEAELKWKEERVREALGRIGGFDTSAIGFEPIIGADSPYRYRNKAIYPVAGARDGRIVSGFFAARTHDIVECGDCLIEPIEFHGILRYIVSWMEEEGIEPYDEADGSGSVRHVMLRKALATGEISFVIVARQKPRGEALTRLTAGLRARWPGVASIGLCLNRAPGNAVLNGEIIDLYGPGYIEDILLGVRLRISAKSFYQVNPVGAGKLYTTAMEYASLRGDETVLDLYSGIGSISLIAARRAGEVCGIEVVEEAVKDARINAKINDINNISFIAGKVEDIMPAPGVQGHSFDTVFLDPPRKGSGERTLRAVADASPDKIVYISCNPSTLARDLKLLKECGYRLTRVRPVDMFPRTTHVEMVVLMSRTGA